VCVCIDAKLVSPSSTTLGRRSNAQDVRRSDKARHDARDEMDLPFKCCMAECTNPVIGRKRYPGVRAPVELRGS
jgi:hypothetical protein